MMQALKGSWVASTDSAALELVSFFMAAMYLSFDLRFDDLWHEALPQFCLMQIMCWTQYIISVTLVALLFAVGILDEGTHKAVAVAVSEGIQGDVSLGVDVGKATEIYQRLGYPTGVEVSMAASSIGNLVATLLSLAILVRNYNSGHYDSHHHHRLHEEGFDPRITPSLTPIPTLTPNPDPYPYP